MSRCEEHGTEKHIEPLTRFDGSQIGSLTIEVCDRCDEEADANLSAVIGRFIDGVGEGTE